MHKTTADEVLLTGWQATGEDAFTVTARWPVDHPFYEPVAGFQDPMLIAESVRQAVPLLSHVAYGVPFGHCQSWSRFRYSLESDGLATACGPTDVELRITCTDVTRRGTVLAGMTMHVDLVADGMPLGTAQSTFRNHAPAIYRRLRGEYADTAWSKAVAAPVPMAVPPRSVGRRCEDDVVLALAGPLTPGHLLRVNTRHPILFDHPLDHAPGMLLLEAARQAANSTAGHQRLIPTTFDASFARYVELDAPCWIQVDQVSATANGSCSVRLSALQEHERVFTALVGLERLGAR